MLIRRFIRYVIQYYHVSSLFSMSIPIHMFKKMIQILFCFLLKDEK